MRKFVFSNTLFLDSLNPSKFRKNIFQLLVNDLESQEWIVNQQSYAVINPCETGKGPVHPGSAGAGGKE